MPGGLGDTAALFLRCASFVAAVALWIGFGTPIAAVTAGVIQVGIMALNHRYDSLAAIGAALAVALAMLGPGAWSLDARLFGRKRIV
jgi:putative oxidoreductase